jgi:ketosteroid isomerase-like protein
MPANDDDEQQIVRLFEDGDRALISADVDELRRIYADDYLQYDESGGVVTKEDLIRRLTSGAIRFFSMTSTGRRVRLFGDFAIAHGSEEDEIEQDGRRFSVRYLYMDVVVKREGRWQIVGSQLARADT